MDRRSGLERERGADAPFTAHPDPEQHPQADELPVGLRQPAEYRNRRVEEHVEHQRQPAPEPIRHQPEHDRANRPHRERQRDRQRNARPRFFQRRSGKERVREILDDESQDEEIERIERPAQEPGENGIALIGCPGGVAAGRPGPAVTGIPFA
jgi:hypothetical protein